jgi:hypothetical protein
MTDSKIRFILNGTHRDEHSIIGTLAGYRELGKRISAAVDNYKDGDEELDLKISDLILYTDDQEYEDVGFDCFTVDVNCGLENKKFKMAKRASIKDKLFTAGCGILVLCAFLLMIMGAIHVFGLLK